MNTSKELPIHIESFLSRHGKGVTGMVMRAMLCGDKVSRLDKHLGKSFNSVHSMASYLKNELGIPVTANKIKGSSVKEYFILESRLNKMLTSDELLAEQITKQKQRTHAKRIKRAQEQLAKLLAMKDFY